MPSPSYSITPPPYSPVGPGPDRQTAPSPTPTPTPTPAPASTPPESEDSSGGSHLCFDLTTRLCHDLRLEEEP